MSRPSGYVAWASTATNVAEPTDAKKAAGWAVSEKPASSYFNWLIQKQDQWIQYMSWRLSLDKVIYDDFIYPTGFAFPNGQNPSGFGWKWFCNPSGPMSGSVVHGTSISLGLQPVAEMPGYVSIVSQASGIAPLVQPVKVGTRDFRMEMIGNIDRISLAGPSAYAQFGFPDFCAFRNTGMSAMGLQIVPSGGSLGSATMWAVTGGPSGLFFASAASGYGQTINKYVLERQGATMVIEVNDVRILSVPAVVFGQSGQNLDFGARLQGVNSGDIRAVVDKLSLELARSPV